MHPLGDPTLQALPLAGRESEFAALVAACERARRGEVTMVVLAGAAGIGKTRLASEFLRWAARARGAEVLRGQAFEAGGRLPYQTLVEALRTRLERERAPDDLLDDVWLAELSRLLPELRERYPDLAAPTGEDGVAAERLFEAVAQVGLALARRSRASSESTPASGAPLILFLDDAQWTDVGTRDLVRFVVRRWREAGVPSMVLLTVRGEDLSTSGELREWLRELARDVGETAMATVTLGALGADTLGQLMEELAVEENAGVIEGADAGAHGAAGTGGDRSVPDLPLPAASPVAAASQAASQPVTHLAQWLYAETGGQPLYLVQMLRTLIEQGALAWEERAEAQPATAITARRASARWQLRVGLSPQEIANLGRVLPASMRAVILQRLERLGAGTRQFLMAGAVLGTRFRPEQAWAIADLDEVAGLEALEEAERLFVIQADPDGMEGESYQFTHDKLAEVIYTETGAVRRRILHRRAYEVLAREGERASPAEMAHHALQASLRELACRQSSAAGDAALAVYAVRDAIRYYEQARQLLAEGWNGERGEGGQLPAEAAAVRERLYNQLGRAHEWVGAWEEAVGAYEALLQHARERNDRALEATTLLRLAVTAWHAFDMPTAQARAREALALADATGDVPFRAEAEWTVGQVDTIAGAVDEALPHAQRAVELARTAELPELVARGLARLAMTQLFSGAWDEAVAAASQAHGCYAALAERARAPSTSTSTPATPAGRTQETAAGWAFGGSLPTTAAALQSMEAQALSLRAFGEVCRGDPRVGVEVGRTAHRLARDYGSAYAQLYSGSALAVGLIEVGEYEEGLLAARQALDAARENGDRRLTLHAMASLACALQALYRVEDAQAVLEEALTLAERGGIRMWWTIRLLAYRCANRVVAGDWPEATTAALQSMALREELRARLVYFDFARHYETEALLRAGEVERARVDVERLSERVPREHPEGQDRRYQLVLRRMQAVLARFEGQIIEAITQVEAALRLAEEIGVAGERWQLLAELAGLRAAAGDATGAAAAQAHAESIVTALAARIADPQLRATYVRATADALRV